MGEVENEQQITRPKTSYVVFQCEPLSSGTWGGLKSLLCLYHSDEPPGDSQDKMRT